MSNTLRFAGIPSYVSANAKERVKKIIFDWLDSDGFQDGADGATAVAAEIWGENVVQGWLVDHYVEMHGREAIEAASVHA